MLRVLYICNFESPYRIEFWNDLTEYFDVTVLFSETKEQQGERNRKWFGNKKYKFTAHMLKQVKLLGKASICFDVITYLKKQSYELVIFHPYSPPTCILGIIYCIRHKIPYVINSDGGFPKTGKGIREKLKKYLISHAEAYTSTSKLTDDYLAFYGGNRDQMYRYTLTTVREKNIQKTPITDTVKISLREKLGIQESKVTITVGNMIPRKGIDLLLKAARSFDKEIGIYIIGGQPTVKCQQYCEVHSLNNVHFIDFLESENLREYYHAADLLVLPTREDIWGLVVVEAMACGLPVITTNRCLAGIELVTHGKNGYIYSVNDTNTLRKLVNHFFESPHLRKKMSSAAIQSIQNVSIENMVKQHTEIFKTILKNRNISNIKLGKMI